MLCGEGGVVGGVGGIQTVRTKDRGRGGGGKPGARWGTSRGGGEKGRLDSWKADNLCTGSKAYLMRLRGARVHASKALEAGFLFYFFIVICTPVFTRFCCGGDSPG